MSRKTVYWVVLAIAATVFGVIGLWVAGIGGDGELQKVRIGLTKYTGDLPFFIALEKGLFTAEGLEPEVTWFGDSTQALNALAANRVDVLNPISFSAVLALEAKSPGEIRLFLPGGENEEVVGSYLLVRSDSAVRTLADLKGKKIGTYTGATQLLYLRLVLEELGLDPEEDVEIIQVGFSLQLQALEAGQFDVLFTIEPMGTIAINKGAVRVLELNPRVKYIVNPFISGAAVVDAQFLEDSPIAVQKILEICDRAVDFIESNETGAREVLAQYTALDRELAKKAQLLVWFQTTDRFDPGPVQRISDLLAEHDLIAQPVEVAPLFLRRESE